jgi:hypothetical protein
MAVAAENYYHLVGLGRVSKSTMENLRPHFHPSVMFDHSQFLKKNTVKKKHCLQNKKSFLLRYMIPASRPGKTKHHPPWPSENAQVSDRLNAHSNQVKEKQEIQRQ